VTDNEPRFSSTRGARRVRYWPALIPCQVQASSPATGGPSPGLRVHDSPGTTSSALEQASLAALTTAANSYGASRGVKARPIAGRHRTASEPTGIRALAISALPVRTRGMARSDRPPSSGITSRIRLRSRLLRLVWRPDGSR
jgi:hypothetical protein